jgi:transcriptional regulator with XRE-family HTH domain
MDFGKRLQELRTAAGLSQAKLAELSGSSLDSLRNWEQGRAMPKVDTAARLAKALSVSLDTLTGTAEPAAKPRGRRKGK